MGMQKVLNNTDNLQKYISDELDEKFKGFSCFCDHGVLKEALSDDAEAYLYKEQSKIIECLRKLCRAKIYKGIDANQGCITKKRTSSSVYSQNEVIASVHVILLRKADHFFKHQIDRYFNDLPSDVSLIKYLASDWAFLHSRYKALLNGLLPALEYINLNYSKAINSSTQDFSIFDYYEIYFISLLQTKLNEDFPKFLETYIQACFDDDIKEENFLLTEPPLRLIYTYDIPIILEGRQLHFKEFYSNEISRYIRSRMDIKVDFNYLKILTKYLKKNLLITGTISISLLDYSNTILLEQTLLLSSTCMLLLKLFKNAIPLDFGPSKSIKFCNIIDQMEILVSAYSTREMKSLFKSSYVKLIHNSLTQMRSSKKDIYSQFEEISKLILITDREHTLRLIAVSEISNAIGGSITLINSYLKLCDFLIRRFNDNMIANTNEPNQEFDCSIVLYLPELLQLDSTFLTPYSQSLFRRSILMGPQIYFTLVKPEFLEYQLLSVFELRYKNSSTYQALMSVKTEVLSASKLALDFQSHFNSDLEANILVFNRSHVPVAFKDEPSEMAVLPKQLDDDWAKYKHFFLTNDPKSQYKTITPIYQLQLCEVETPYLLRDGNKLILELTLFQATVLSLFNEEDALKYEQIHQKSKIRESTLIEILSTFKSIKLLKVIDNTYYLNESFHPEERKIKHGKLRVLQVKHTKKSLKRDNDEFMNSQHKEGNRSRWMQELIKASIVRSLKGVKDGLKYELLLEKVEAQIYGISIGEFKEAIGKTIRDGCIKKSNDSYIY